MELKIECRNTEMTPRWRSEIERRASDLAELHPELIHARATLTKNPHHRKGDRIAEAHLVLTFPARRTFTARKERETFEEAIRASFEAAALELKKFKEKRSAPGPKLVRGPV